MVKNKQQQLVAGIGVQLCGIPAVDLKGKTDKKHHFALTALSCTFDCRSMIAIHQTSSFCQVVVDIILGVLSVPRDLSFCSIDVPVGSCKDVIYV